MGLLETKEQDQLEGLKPVLEAVSSAMGFVPNSMLTMAHWPELVTAFITLVRPFCSRASWSLS